MLKHLWRNKLLLLLMLSLWLVPITIILPEQSSTESIVIAVGIDKEDEEFNVTLQYVIPNASTSTNSLGMVSEKAKSINGAVEKINSKFGKFSGFAHCRLIVFNDEAVKDNFTQVLDSFLRLKTDTNDIVLISTPKTAKNILKTAKNFDSNLYSFLNNCEFSKELKGFEDLKTIGDYYKMYFGFNKALKINVLNYKESNSSDENLKQESKNSDQNDGNKSESLGEKTSGNEQSSNNQSSSGSSGEGGQSNEDENNKLENNFNAIIIKDSKKLLSLNEEESKNLNWFNKNIEKSVLEIDNYSDENLENANMRFNVYDKKNRVKVYFKDGKPYYDLKVSVHLRSTEVVANNLKENDYEVQQQKFTKKLYETITQSIINKLKSAEEHFKQNNYDVINCEESFYKYCNKQYKQYLKSLPNDKTFLETVNFVYSVKISKGA